VLAILKLSVESVAESMISKYNLHNNAPRSISEENENDEMFLSYNGPKIGGSDGLLREGHTRHFNPKGWHFVKQNHMFQNCRKNIKKKKLSTLL
jgi:hypothetical protein